MSYCVAKKKRKKGSLDGFQTQGKGLEKREEVSLNTLKSDVKN